MLEPPRCRPATFYRGYDVLDRRHVGFVSRRCGARTMPAPGCAAVEVASGCMPEDGGWLYDTSQKGNGNGGHLYGTELPADEKAALVEYLKTV